MPLELAAYRTLPGQLMRELDGIKALSVKQPWCWAITHGLKRIENRKWRPPENMIGKRIALHAALKWDAFAIGEMAKRRAPYAGPSEPGAVMRGALMATAKIVDAFEDWRKVPRDQQCWWMGPIGWLLDDVKRFPPIACRGQLGLWSVADVHIEQIAEYYSGAIPGSTPAVVPPA